MIERSRPWIRRVVIGSACAATAIIAWGYLANRSPDSAWAQTVESWRPLSQATNNPAIIPDESSEWSEPNGSLPGMQRDAYAPRLLSAGRDTGFRALTTQSGLPNPLQYPSADPNSYTKVVVKPVQQTVVRRVPVSVTRTVMDNGKARQVTETSYQDQPYTFTVYTKTYVVETLPHVERLNQLGVEIAQLEQAAGDESQNEKETLIAEMEKLLGEQFDVLHAEQQKRIDEIADRLKKLQETQAGREQARDKIIARRMNELTRTPDPYQWNPLQDPATYPNGSTTPASRFPAPVFIPSAAFQNGDNQGNRWNQPTNSQPHHQVVPLSRAPSLDAGDRYDSADENRLQPQPKVDGRSPDALSSDFPPPTSRDAHPRSSASPQLETDEEADTDAESESGLNKPDEA
ncbi:hypothetical protein [Stieleria varia]|uniref:Uncharacterized protein n=1 Tax=Stieleria varia TaxID=2528005 RepID=A0A5C6ATZ1_9BACT|nr:hypothetical protein [Stieleria varia]TWU02482.1 hypothetical protein Pla52n_35320 [Stieleria varia]